METNFSGSDKLGCGEFTFLFFEMWKTKIFGDIHILWKHEYYSIPNRWHSLRNQFLLLLVAFMADHTVQQCLPNNMLTFTGDPLPEWPYIYERFSVNLVSEPRSHFQRRLPARLLVFVNELCDDDTICSPTSHPQSSKPASSHRDLT